MISNPSTRKTILNTDKFYKESGTEVKLFISTDPEKVQGDIGDWLNENKVRIQHIGQSQSERNGRFVFIISLFYQRA
jgi:hypothetical protein